MKTAEQLRRELLGALIGLARATENNDHLLTPATERITLRGLAATLPGDASEEDLRSLPEEVGREKQRLVPDCFYCAAPCGRTADYDINRLAAASPEVRSLKALLLMTAQNLALCALRKGTWPAALPRHLYLALYAIGMEDWEKQDLLPILLEAGRLGDCFSSPEN